MRTTGAPVVHVVDDDASFRTAISRVLKASGYEVADYESATSFLRAIENTKPGCILLDVQMPALGGLQLQEELAKLSHNWPIIFMTGHGDIPTSVRAIKAGAEDFLSKPVSKQTLLEVIQRAPCGDTAEPGADQFLEVACRHTDTSGSRGLCADGPR
jgi:FixJ family two-component response regulator